MLVKKTEIIEESYLTPRNINKKNTHSIRLNQLVKTQLNECTTLLKKCSHFYCITKLSLIQLLKNCLSKIKQLNLNGNTKQNMPISLRFEKLSDITPCSSEIDVGNYFKSLIHMIRFNFINENYSKHLIDCVLTYEIYSRNKQKKINVKSCCCCFVLNIHSNDMDTQRYSIVIR